MLFRSLLFDGILDNTAFYESYAKIHSMTVPWWVSVLVFCLCTFLMVSRIDFSKPKWFLSFGKSVPKPLLALNILMFLGIVFLLHYTLIVMTLVYMVPSLIRFRLIDKDLVTFEHKLKEESKS